MRRLGPPPRRNDASRALTPCFAASARSSLRSSAHDSSLMPDSENKPLNPSISREEFEQCGAIDSCDACVKQRGCGWCADSSSCVGGAPAGPVDLAGGRIEPDYDKCQVWAYSQCRGAGPRTGCTVLHLPARAMGPPHDLTAPFVLDSPAESCEAKKGCNTCVSDVFCGWCGSTQQCMEGNTKGPVTGFCDLGWVRAPISKDTTSEHLQQVRLPQQRSGDAPPLSLPHSAACTVCHLVARAAA